MKRVLAHRFISEKAFKERNLGKPTFSYLAAILFVLDTLENILRLGEAVDENIIKSYILNSDRYGGHTLTSLFIKVSTSCFKYHHPYDV